MGPWYDVQTRIYDKSFSEWGMGGGGVDDYVSGGVNKTALPGDGTAYRVGKLAPNSIHA